MKKILVSVLALALVIGCAALKKAELDSNEVHKTLIANFSELEGSTITKSVVEPLFEVSKDGRTVYTTDGNFVIVGIIFDKAKNNLTPIVYNNEPQQQEPDTPQVRDMSFLDFMSAVKIGSGKGHTVVEFTDVDCPFCRRAETFFDDEKGDYTRYVYLVALNMHPEAKKKSVHILCASNPAEEYKKVMFDSVTDFRTCERGEELFKQHETYAYAAGMNGTPMFFVDGVVVEGANPKIKELLK